MNPLRLLVGFQRHQSHLIQPVEPPFLSGDEAQNGFSHTSAHGAVEICPLPVCACALARACKTCVKRPSPQLHHHNQPAERRRRAVCSWWDYLPPRLKASVIWGHFKRALHRVCCCVVFGPAKMFVLFFFWGGGGSENPWKHFWLNMLNSSRLTDGKIPW